MELQYTTMSNVMTIRPYTETAKEKAQNPGNFMVFTGCDLTQAKLKDWLRDCAPKVGNNVLYNLNADVEHP